MLNLESFLVCVGFSCYVLLYVCVCVGGGGGGVGLTDFDYVYLITRVPTDYIIYGWPLIWGRLIRVRVS